MASPSSCVVLVPAGGAIDPGCDDALRELERRGYPVWRVRGYSAIDAARNQMASDALGQGFTEFVWIDSDIAFDPNDVDRLRLWHVGPYRYGWEDAGGALDRFGDYSFHIKISGRSRGTSRQISGRSRGTARQISGRSCGTSRQISGRSRGTARQSLPAAPPSAEVSDGYTEDWFTYNVPVWERLLSGLAGRDICALEIGVFEGRSSVWLLEHVLTHPKATLTWIDTFAGGAEHRELDMPGVESRFRANTARFDDKVRGHVGKSQDVLRSMSGERFDLIYIDGSHEAPDVLADAVLAWPLLKPGGLMGFDDYTWHGFPEPERCPALAIDAFLGVMRGRYTELHRKYQVWVRKNELTQTS